MDAPVPRSTWIHCGSEKAEDHRVPGLPSTAAPAGVPAFSMDDAVTGLPWDSSVLAARAGPAVTAAYPPSRTTAAATSAPATRAGLRRWVMRGDTGGMTTPDGCPRRLAAGTTRWRAGSGCLAHASSELNSDLKLRRKHRRCQGNTAAVTQGFRVPALGGCPRAFGWKLSPVADVTPTFCQVFMRWCATI